MTEKLRVAGVKALMALIVFGQIFRLCLQIRLFIGTILAEYQTKEMRIAAVNLVLICAAQASSLKYLRIALNMTPKLWCALSYTPLLRADRPD